MLAQINAKLTNAQSTLIGLYDNGSVRFSVGGKAAPVSVFAAITAVAAAMANPEPMTYTPSVITAIDAIVAAVAAIQQVIDEIKANNAIEKVEKVVEDMKNHQKELNALLKELQREFGQ